MGERRAESSVSNGPVVVDQGDYGFTVPSQVIGSRAMQALFSTFVTVLCN
jgi:hypothetical protein